MTDRRASLGRELASPPVGRPGGRRRRRARLARCGSARRARSRATALTASCRTVRVVVGGGAVDQHRAGLLPRPTPWVRALTAVSRTSGWWSVVARSISIVQVCSSGQVSGNGPHRFLPDVGVVVGGGAVDQHRASLLPRPTLGKGLHRCLSDVGVVVGGGAVDQPSTGLLIGPAVRRGTRLLPCRTSE